MLAFLLLFVAFAQATPWYLARDLSREEKNYLTSLACFRGTYGRFNLSILTCEDAKGEEFANLPLDAPICVVEVEDSRKALSVIAENDDGAQVLWTGMSEIILTGTGDYPILSCGSRSDYRGTALNVIRVPQFPIVPEQPLPPLTAQAPDVRIQELLALIDPTRLQEWVNTLAGFGSRYSPTASAQAAVDWAALQLTEFGFSVEQQYFGDAYCNNIIARKTGQLNPDNVFIIGAHLDSRSQNATSSVNSAPGADDNGSGSAMILELARVIRSTNFQTENSIVLALYCGEEQGLRGSAAMATSFLADTSKKYIAAYNGDMLGWNCVAKGNPANRLAFMSGGASEALNLECQSIVAEYYPELLYGYTSACCSDQQSWQTRGVPALGVFECTGNGVAYPSYHTTQDLPGPLDYDQIQRFSQALIACFLTRARPYGL